MITIGKPFIYDDGKYAYLKASIKISDDTAKAYMSLKSRFKKVHWRLYENYPPVEWNKDDEGLWFGVPIEYKKYLCAERDDAFLVAMLWYAMVTGSDIECKAPISEKMAFGIKYHLIPALMKEEKGYNHHINLLCETTDSPYPNEAAVGTGMSCGVDSMYTLDIYSQPDVPQKFKLTHLTYFNMGAIFHPDRSTKKVYSMKEFYETTDKMSEEKLENARKVAEISNLPILYVKSNLDSDYYRGAYGDTGVYRNCACVLAVAGLFGVYYCSSKGRPENFDLNLDMGSEHYETLLCDALSTESLQFIVSDYATRLEKMKVISMDKVSKDFLDVCFCFNSCGECSKCLRTLVTLDIMGEVDNFSNVFDINKYKTMRDKAFLWLLKTKDGGGADDDACHARLIYDYAIRHGFEIPAESIKEYEKHKKRIKQKQIKQIAKRILKRK